MATTVETERKASAPSNGAISVENPATGETIGSVPDRSPDEVAAIVARSRAVQPAWEALGYEGRAEVFNRARTWVFDHSQEIIASIQRETGKTYEDAQIAEISYVAGAFQFWARNAPKMLADERVRSASPLLVGRKLIVSYRPLGCVGVIGPWNFPLTNSFGDCIPALAAGNGVVLKPSEVTPLTSLIMERMLRECGAPEGLFAVATGAAETGGALIDEVDFVMFTGSTATGRKVMERAAQTITPVGLELGGKDPMLVLEDADLERAARAAAYYSMNNGGQVCISIERAYVEAPVYDEFVRRVTDEVSALRQGVPSGPGSVEIGAVTFAPQVETIDAHVRDAVEKGARVTTGGHRGDGPGQFYEPTVLADADHSMDCMREETFGPTLPIMRVADAEEGIRLANDSPYGLAASVFTRDLERGEQIARRLEAGATCVNDAQLFYAAYDVPMGGWKASGLGSRHGAGGIRKYCAEQTVMITRYTPRKPPWMFPYRPRVTRALGGAVKLMYGRRRRS